MELTVKPLKFSKELVGISKKQITEHHDVLYAGYVKKANEIRAKLKEASLEEANATFSQLRELKVEETFALNGVRLHEGYFDDLGGDGKAFGEILRLIEADFDSYEAWEKEFRALGLCSRGWVILAYDWEEKKLRNFLCDLHNQGGIWNATPLLILDVYEHAYFLDYGTGRKAYIEAYMKNIDWDFVNQMVKRYNVMAHRK